MAQRPQTGTDVHSEARPRIPADIAAVLTDAAAYGDGRLQDAFTWLRANEPMGIADTETFDPFWVVTRQADIRSIATQPDVFNSSEASIAPIDKEEQRHTRELLEGRPEPARMIISMDAPDHSVYRAITEDLFRPGKLMEMTEKVRVIARGFIDQMAESGNECDFAKTIAFVYPLRVVMSLIGIPPEDEPYMLKLTQQMVGNHDGEQSRAGVALHGADAAEQHIAVVDDFNDFYTKVRADRLANPRQDIATLLAQATIDGKPMPTLESLSYYLILSTAGHDTTAAVTAGGMIELARRPDEFAKLKANPNLMPLFIEEAIRWVSPSKMTMRTANRDVEFNGREIRKGDLLGLAWASANRDESVFEDPFTFKCDRMPNKLMAFGTGVHVCLGQHLARLEMRILFEELLKRLEHVELSGPIRTVASFQISGPKTAPIRFKMN